MTHGPSHYHISSKVDSIHMPEGLQTHLETYIVYTRYSSLSGHRQMSEITRRIAHETMSSITPGRRSAAPRDPHFTRHCEIGETLQSGNYILSRSTTYSIRLKVKGIQLKTHAPAAMATAKRMTYSACMQATRPPNLKIMDSTGKSFFSKRSDMPTRVMKKGVRVDRG